jgi:hypothetical protein
MAVILEALDLAEDRIGIGPYAVLGLGVENALPNSTIKR